MQLSADMTEMMEQLKPIAEILGPLSVKADYSQTQIGVRDRLGDIQYLPRWKVAVKGTYKGASVGITKSAATLDEAASEALAELKEALGLP